MESLLTYRKRDQWVFVISCLWLLVSVIPSFHKAQDSFMLFGIERDRWYFVYDCLNKFGVLWGFLIAYMPEKKYWARIVIAPLLLDAGYEFFDLIATNDNGLPFGLILQNLTILTGFLWSLRVEQKKKC